MRAVDWDTVVVLVNPGYWWWNAWRERTATELSGTAGTRGEAATAMERAITGVGRPTDQLGPRRERP